MALISDVLRHRFETDNNKISSETLCKSNANDISPKSKLIGIDGKWYDIRDFISKHPGGPMIEKYIGHDASAVFRSLWPHKDVLKYRKPVGTYKIAKKHPADEDFKDLIRAFGEKGWYQTDWSWYRKKIAFVLSLIASTFVCVIAFDEWYINYLGAVFLVLSFQQCGFLMHDFMHLQGFREIQKDKMLGLFFGSFLFGVSSHWWHDEHMIHHTFTNTIDAKNGFADPQMWEDVWAQNEKLFPLCKGIAKYCAIKVQHITYIPLTMLCGRVGILLDCYIPERRWYEFVAIGGHWLWTCYLLSWLPTWWSVFVFYSILSVLEGVLHFQIVFNHYCKMFYNIDEYHSTSWYVTQILSNLNIANPWWMDWFHGGLNFHIEHHLFPRIARHRLREAGEYVKAICLKHDIEYEMIGFFPGLWKILCQLKECGSNFKLEYI